MHCTRCGHQNPEGSRFCAQCGAALSQERIGESTSVIPKVGGEDSAETPEVTEADAHAGAVESLPAVVHVLSVCSLIWKSTVATPEPPVSDALAASVIVPRFGVPGSVIVADGASVSTLATCALVYVATLPTWSVTT